MSQKKFLTTSDITQLYGIDEETVRSLVDAGDLKALADRGTWKYRRDEIEALIQQGKVFGSKELPSADEFEVDDSLAFEGDGGPSGNVDFLELDEEALSGQSTIVSSGGHLPEEVLKLSLNEPSGDSAGDIHVFEPSETTASDSDILVRRNSADDLSVFAAPPSSSDVQVYDEDAVPSAGEMDSSTAADAAASADDASDFLRSLGEQDADFSFADQVQPVEGIVLDLDDSSGRMPQPSLKADADAEARVVTEELGVFEPDVDVPVGGTARLQRPTDLPTSFEIPEEAMTLASDESALEEMPLATGAGDSGLTFESTDSGLTLDTGDSGLTLEAGDSGLTLDAGDSGLTLDAGDSGLTLDAGDSGLTLDAGDSGLSLEVVPDDQPSVAPVAATQRMEELAAVSDDDLDFDSGSGDSDGTRRLAVEERFAEERAFLDDDEEPTAVIMLDDDDATDADYVGTLSGTLAAGGEVEDLELADDLQAEGDDFAAADDDVIDAGDEAFSDEFAGDEGVEDDEESYLAPAAVAAPREPRWSPLVAMLVFASTGLVGANVWLMWEGMSTMWTGSEPSGLASSIISSLGGLISG